jgi:hypothetical protein
LTSTSDGPGDSRLRAAAGNLPARLIEGRIIELRGVRVILDHDLAVIYGVPTKRLNEQYRRNLHRFPEDFAFSLLPSVFALSPFRLHLLPLISVRIWRKLAAAVRSRLASLPPPRRGEHIS